jgi:hypothetical protein
MSISLYTRECVISELGFQLMEHEESVGAPSGVCPGQSTRIDAISGLQVETLVVALSVVSPGEVCILRPG